MTIKISPLSPFGIILGLMIQTLFFGWNIPVTFINIILVMFNIFILPTVSCSLILIIIVSLFAIMGVLISNGRV